MTESARERIIVAATPIRCFDVAADFESYPEWVRDVKSVRVLDRNEDGLGTRVEYRAAALGRSVRYVLVYDFSQAPAAFSWTLEEGDLLRRLDGEYRFESDGDRTRVHYDLSVDVSMPVPGLLKRRAAGIIMGSALKDLKKQVELVA